MKFNIAKKVPFLNVKKIIMDGYRKEIMQLFNEEEKNIIKDIYKY